MLIQLFVYTSRFLLIGYVGLMLRSTRCGYCKSQVLLKVLWGYSDAIVTKSWEATAHAVAADYPHSTLNGTTTSSSHTRYCVIWDPLETWRHTAFSTHSTHARQSLSRTCSQSHVYFVANRGFARRGSYDFAPLLGFHLYSAVWRKITKLAIILD